MSAGGRWILVHVPQGSGIADLVRIAGMEVERLGLVGFAGGLADDLRLGDAFALSSVLPSLSLGGPSLEAGFRPLDDRAGPILAADGFLQFDAETLEEARRAGVWGVEMECLHLLRAAVGLPVECGGMFVVSDRPLEEPFYAIGAQARSRIDDGVRRLCSRLAALDE